MTLEIVPLQPLERGYLRVLRIRAAIGWLVLWGVLTGVDGVLHARLGLPFGWVSGPVPALAVGSVVLLVPRRWRRWGYAFTDRELHVAQGWLVRTHTVVPVSRVQHIDVSQGPLERSAGVATLSLHTAGTEGSLVRLPGIRRERAEDIRDAIRSRIGDTPW
ncbi:PH domain-containing protein [Brevundimonas staleyi]|uniref:PH domain-containing protein n=1 Tax=Brevundimonas staleyi TaxID=74326 RepID=A0ABW0FVQ7_9CAUL